MINVIIVLIVILIFLVNKETEDKIKKLKEAVYELDNDVDLLRGTLHRTNASQNADRDAFTTGVLMVANATKEIANKIGYKFDINEKDILVVKKLSKNDKSKSNKSNKPNKSDNTRNNKSNNKKLSKVKKGA